MVPKKLGKSHVVQISEKKAFDTLRREYQIPNFITIRLLREDEQYCHHGGIEDGCIVLRRRRLETLRFPLHSLIHHLFVITNLYPMQLNLNSLRVLVAAAILNHTSNLQITCEDIFFLKPTQ